MEKESKIYIAGHKGLVGSAILRDLKNKGYKNLVTRTHKELDLTDSVAVENFFKNEKPEYVFLAAAKVGGIVANNTFRAEFMYENLMIQTNVIHQSYLHDVKKLLFLGSTCIYPKNSQQPIKEEALLTGPLEYTNEPYAIAKIAGFKMCESYNLQYGTNFIAVMPTNLYGPNDNFDLMKSHVLPALVRKMYLGKAIEEQRWKVIEEDLDKRPIEGVKGSAKREEILQTLDRHGIRLVPAEDGEKQKPKVSIEIWGSGRPRREFLWSEDMADACVFLMERIDFKDIISDYQRGEKKKDVRNTHINIGTGEDISIKDLAFMIKEVVGFNGQLFFNTEKADGTMRKLTDNSKLTSMGWSHKLELKEGIEEMLRELTEESPTKMARMGIAINNFRPAFLE